MRMLLSSRSSAATNGLEHSISVNDIPLPLTCCYLGVPLDYSSHKERGAKTQSMATIDRIDPTKGYVPGNIQVISWLANRMKTDASVEQLLAFAIGVIRRHGAQA